MAGALEKYMAKKAAKKALTSDGDIPKVSSKEVVKGEDSLAMKKGKLSVDEDCKGKNKKRPYLD